MTNTMAVPIICAVAEMPIEPISTAKTAPNAAWRQGGHMPNAASWARAAPALSSAARASAGEIVSLVIITPSLSKMESE